MMADDWKFKLFSPFLRDRVVDARLLRALGISPGTRYDGQFGKVFEEDGNTTFDFYMEAESGRKIFFDLKLAEAGFGTCADDARHREELERLYRPRLHGHVDEKWLEPATFFGHYEVLSKLSYLGRYPDSGFAFIFPKANRQIMAAETAVKQIVSKSLAPRLAIFYLEYLVERILEAVAGDESLRAHFLAFREGYVVPLLASSAPPPA